MKIPYEGELYLKFDKGYPWYTMKRDYCIKVLFRIGKFYLSLRCKNITGYKPWIKAKLLKTFDAILNLSHTITLNEDDDDWFITLTVKIKEEYLSAIEYNILQESKN